jgi:N-acetylmuramoyl-L-alanine amidase CwlA
VNAEWIGSPNFTPGRDGHSMAVEPAYVVLHTMVGTIESATARFHDPASQVSAHYGVGYDGSRLVQWVNEDDAAWHAGSWSVNLDSIGIEHEDRGQFNAPRPDGLYTAAAALVRDVCGRYGIPIDRAHIRAHREVSESPTACPDALDVERIVREAANPPKEENQDVPLTADQEQKLNTMEAKVAHVEALVARIYNVLMTGDQLSGPAAPDESGSALKTLLDRERGEDVGGAKP